MKCKKSLYYAGFCILFIPFDTKPSAQCRHTSIEYLSDLRKIHPARVGNDFGYRIERVGCFPDSRFPFMIEPEREVVFPHLHGNDSRQYLIRNFQRWCDVTASGFFGDILKILAGDFTNSHELVRDEQIDTGTRFRFRQCLHRFRHGLDVFARFLEAACRQVLVTGQPEMIVEA